MNIKDNHRRQETKQKVERAFWELLKTNPITKITISDICTLANINRSTFYDIYDDLPDLAVVVEQKIQMELCDMWKQQTGKDFVWLFQHILQHKEDFQIYFSLYERYPADLLHLEGKAEYRKLFVWNGVHAVIKMWIAGGCKESPEDMSEILKKHTDTLT